jgi:hypothetical protein
MRTSSLLCLVILISTSCSLFQRTTKNSSESSQKNSSSLRMNTAAETNMVKHIEQLQTQKDTVLADYSIRFWPKGELTFLPSGGFSGEFDSVQLKGKLKMLSNSSASVRTDEQKNEIKHENLQADQNENFSKKAVLKTNSIDMKMLFFIAFVLLAGLYFWLRKMNLKRR